MEALSGISFAAYRRLAEHPGLVTYYQAASPVEELVWLKMGSRPARRFGAKSLDDLRAISWNFGWSQNRHLVPGWFGIGSALKRFMDRSRANRRGRCCEACSRTRTCSAWCSTRSRRR